MAVAPSWFHDIRNCLYHLDLLCWHGSAGNNFSFRPTTKELTLRRYYAALFCTVARRPSGASAGPNVKRLRAKAQAHQPTISVAQVPIPPSTFPFKFSPNPAKGSASPLLRTGCRDAPCPYPRALKFSPVASPAASVCCRTGA